MYQKERKHFTDSLQIFFLLDKLVKQKIKARCKTIIYLKHNVLACDENNLKHIKIIIQLNELRSPFIKIM